MRGAIYPDNFLDPSGGGGIALSDRLLKPYTTDMVSYTNSTQSSVAIAANASANTLGNYVELVSSLSEDSDGLLMYCPASGTPGANSSSIFEIGVGAAGSEVVSAKWLAGFPATGNLWFIPCHIPAGSRVAVRGQSAVGGRTLNSVLFRFIKAGSTPFGPSTMYGFDASTSKGVPLTAAEAINTKSSWTQIVAATSAEHNVMSVFIQANGNSTITALGVLVDIGIGAEGAEVVIAPDILMIPSSTTESLALRALHAYGVNIPVGSRIAARYQSNVVDSYDVALVCV